MAHVAGKSDQPAQIVSLRGRIGWICHIVRAICALYAVWVLVTIVHLWTGPSGIARSFGAFYETDLTGVSPWQLASGFAVHFTIWLAACATCYCIWRVFTGYLQGDIFSVAAAVWLRRAAMSGFLAQAMDIASRPLISTLLTAHLPAAQRVFKFYFWPNDLLNILFFFGIFALAHVFKTAAEIADDNRQFV